MCSNCEADQRFSLRQFLYFLNPKFPASSHLLCLYSAVCAVPIRKPNCWFTHDAAHIFCIPWFYGINPGVHIFTLIISILESSENVSVYFRIDNSVSSSTQTTCRDKKGIDCASMDKYFFICKDRVSATNTCPRFCGLCRTNISSHSTVTSPSASQTMISSPAKNDSATTSPTAPFESPWSTEMSTDSDVWTSHTSDKYDSTVVESSPQSTVTLTGSATTSLEESTVSAYPTSTENMSLTTTGTLVDYIQKRLCTKIYSVKLSIYALSQDDLFELMLNVPVSS